MNLRPKGLPFVFASDAHYDGGISRGAFLFHDLDRGFKFGACFVFSAQMLNVLGFCEESLRMGANPIAVCEAFTVAVGIVWCIPFLSGR